MSYKYFRLFVWSFLMMLGMTQSAMAADFKDFSVIVNNQSGTLLTSEEQVQGTAVSFGVAVADDGTVSRVAVDDASSVATVSGTYHSDHGCTGLSIVVPVNGNVKITVGQCTFSGNTITVKNSNGETVVSKTPSGPACWKNDRSNVDELTYVGDATTLTISGMGYCPYVAVEAIETVITKYNVNFSLGSETAEGAVPASSEVVAGESVTIPGNFTLYKEGYTLTGWTDGTNTYALNTNVAPESDLTLTPVFTQNSVALADREAPVTLKWDFQRKNGAPTVQYQNVTGIWVTQAIVNGETIDVKLDFNTSPGKINNSSWTDWAQMNNGTTLTIPSCKGATVSMEAFSDITTTTIDGQSDYTSAKTISYEIANSAETIDIVIGDGSYYRYIQTVLPVVQSSTGGETIEGSGTITWSVGNEENGTVSDEIAKGISSATVSVGSGLTVSTATYFETPMVHYTPKTSNAGAVEGVMIEYRVKPVKGIKFKPTNVSYAAVKVGTDNATYSWSYTVDGVESSITKIDPKPDLLRNNGTNSSTAQLIHSHDINASEADEFTFRFYISDCANNKNICIGNVIITGEVSGTTEEVVNYSFSATASPEEGGSVTIYPNASEYESGSEITLTATENFGYDFVNWTDAEGNVVSTEAKFKYTVESEAALTANFVAVNTYALDLTVDGTNDYMVEVNPVGTVVDGKMMYEEGVYVTLTANSYEGLVTFNNWSDGQTVSEITLKMDGNKEIAAVYSQEDIIAGWDFYKSGNSGRVADFYSTENEASAFTLTNGTDATSWLDKSTEAANGYESMKGAAVNWKTGSGNGDVGHYYWQTKVNAEAFTNIKVQFDMLFNYNSYTVYNVEYSTDGENWTGNGSITLTGAKAVCHYENTLPEDVNNQASLYIRMIPDYTSEIKGSASANDGNTVGMFFITGTEELVNDGIAPVLVSSVPEEGSDNASANGKIVLTFDEKVALADGAVATLNGQDFEGVVSGKTIMFEYKGLEYSTEYTFTLPANSVSDLTENYLEYPITITFSTMTRPAIEKGLYDYYVKTTDDLVAAINEANNRSDKNVRYRIFLYNGTYALPLSTSETINSDDGNTYPAPYTKISASNISFDGESREGVIITNFPDGAGTYAGQYGQTSVYDGIGKSDVLQIQGNVEGLYFQDVTVKSGLGDALGRNIAVQDKGKKNIYKNVKLWGYQDTWTSNNDNGLYYFEGGLVRGRTDFLCGKGDIFFNETEIQVCMNTGGYIAVPSKSVKYGFVFNNCTINCESSSLNGKYTLGRPWGQGTPSALWINTKMQYAPSAIGWSEMSNGWPKRFAEYNSTLLGGTTIDLSGRKTTFGDGHTNNPVLTAAEAAEASDMTNMFGDWDPTYYTEQASAPQNVTLEGNTLSWDNSNYVYCWAIVKDGSVIDFTTEPTYEVDDANATYAVRAANEMGGLGEATEAVVVETGIILSDTDTEAPAPGTYATITYDRTLTEKLNTLVLPFNTTKEEIGATYVLAYTGTTEENDALTLNFEEVEEMEANVPYAIIIEGEDVTLPVFENKTIVEPNDLTVSDANFSFVGTYTDFGRQNSIVKLGDYIAGVTSFKKASGGNRIAAYRAYFRQETETGAKLVFNFAGHDISNVGDLVSEDGGFVDGINQASVESSDSEVYNLQGIRVKKANKGVYIQNGKKVVIK
ncbi:MAG: Ig-like domain-containing protein [Prevotella sp.]|nr:Ig-like domain-containing protein [Prevotella sp.]